MNLSYAARLACLSLASFFFVNAVAGAAFTAGSKRLIEFSARLGASSAARFLFIIRVLPALLAIFAVIALCIPSYLWLEPTADAESIGSLCVAAALAAVGISMRSVVRGSRALVELRRFLNACRGNGREVEISGHRALLIDAKGTALAAGVFRANIVVSPDVLAVLTDEQIEVAIQHERAHSKSRDNLKRLAMLLAPDVFPLRKIESAWHKFSEWAADDEAVARDRGRALALAEALIGVARIGAVTPVILSTSLLGEDFSARVHRLLEPPAPSAAPRWKTAAVASVLAAAVLLRPATLDLVHRALEKLVR
jgi:Zn-dependent protease with chaperone function